MRRRSAVTLMEVLIAMFIMAIGMMALLVLFPVGAVSMAQALKDDRCATTAAMAESVAIAENVRHDANVTTGFSTSLSQCVYVDPYGVLTMPAPGTTSVGGAVPAVIPRVSPSFLANYGSVSFATDRFFSLPDDMTFLENGAPDTITTGGTIDRGRRYSYAYLLRQQATDLIQLYVVAYHGRPVQTLTAEPTFSAAPPALPMLGTAGTNSLTIPAANTTIKRGGWVLDTTNPATTTPAAPGYFYRVTNVAENNLAGTTTVELQTNLIGNVMQIAVMDYVAEVFDKGTSWQP